MDQDFFYEIDPFAILMFFLYFCYLLRELVKFILEELSDAFEGLE